MKRKLRFLFDRLFRREQLDREMDEEMRAHVELRAAELQQAGLSWEEARRRARVEFGGAENYKEQCRETRRFHLLHDFLADLRYGLRMLRKSPGFTFVAVLTLAVGIGANTAIFSLIDAVLFQTLPVQHPEEMRTLGVLWRDGTTMNNVPSEFFDQIRQGPQSFSHVAGFWQHNMNFGGGGDTERILVQHVSGSYYATLGVSSFLGRTINEADENNRAHVAVLSYPFWVRRFAADPAVIGKTVEVERVPMEVIGITPPGFFGMDRGVSPDVSIPLENPVQFARVWIIVRLKPNVSDKQAQAEAEVALSRALESIRPRLGNYRAATRKAILAQRAVLLPGDRGMGWALSRYEAPLRILILLSALVLLIACINIANLLLARAATRTSEIGVRLALGASRHRVLRQLITESALLSLMGTLAGVVLAFWMQPVLIRLLMGDAISSGVDFALNSHIALFSAAMAMATLLVSGVVPAWRATTPDIWSVLKHDTNSMRRPRLKLTKALIIAEVAACMILLVGAGLLVRSFQSLTAVDVGMPMQNMLTMRIDIRRTDYPKARTAAVYQDLVARTETVPGVVSAALGWDFAFSSGSAGKSVWVEGQPAERPQGAGFNVVGPGFFANAGIPVIRGREFSPGDILGSTKVVVINEAFARLYFPNQDPLGRHIGDEGANSVKKYEVVGVVKDSRNMFLRSAPEPVLYQPLLQDEWASNVVLHVRTRGNPRLIQDRVRAEIRSINRQLPVYDVTTLSERLSVALRKDRMMAILAGFFGNVALLLTIIGVYGLIAYAVGRRRTEIGIRTAIGATRGALVWMVVRETLALVAVGVTIGIPTALAFARMLRSMLFGVKPQDPITAMVCATLLLAAGIAAAYLPARRAAKVDPMVALRFE